MLYKFSVTNHLLHFLTVNSTSSVTSTKYDPDLLKADVALAKKRVSLLRGELDQIRTEMTYKAQGVQTLRQ